MAGKTPRSVWRSKFAVVMASQPSKRSDTTQRQVPDVPLSIPSWKPLHPTKVFGMDGKPHHENIKEHFVLEGRLAKEDAMEIIAGATKLFQNQPNVLRIEKRTKIVGDIHGQFYDMLKIFKTHGDVSKMHYLFLGDYVDRGIYGVEVVLYLFALKVCYPDQIQLLRGNHECRHMTHAFDFEDECKYKYDEEVYDAMMNAFDHLPLAAVITNQLMCMHGGISPDLRTIEDFNKVNRVQEPPTKGPMWCV